MRMHFAKGLIVVVCLFTAAVAEGATTVSYTKGSEPTAAVTTGAMVRARADVAIRRIRSVIVSKAATNDDAAYEHLEKLQKQLRGQN